MGVEKGMCLIDGMPMISYALKLLGSLFSSVYIGSNNLEYNSFGYPVVPDKVKNIGPLGGIYSCLKVSPSDDNFILSCDMPLVSSDLIQYILSIRENYEVVIPMFRGYPEPLCAYYHKAIVPHIESSIEKNIFKIQDVIKVLKTKYLEIDPSLSFYREDLFINVNSPQDLEDIQK